MSGQNVSYPRATSKITFSSGFHFAANSSSDHFKAKIITVVTTKSAISDESISMEPENQEGEELGMYPNPTDGMLYIELLDINSPVTLNIVDLSGKTVFSEMISDIQTQVDLSEFGSGVYIINIQSEELNETRKITVL